MCNCNTGTEATSHYLLPCHHFSEQRKKLLDNLRNIDHELLKLDESSLVNILLYGSKSYNVAVNKSILFNTIDFLKTTKRFDKPLF